VGFGRGKLFGRRVGTAAMDMNSFKGFCGGVHARVYPVRLRVDGRVWENFEMSLGAILG
jgi:hypothetical protein